jgi:hypothetical protein
VEQKHPELLRYGNSDSDFSQIPKGFSEFNEYLGLPHKKGIQYPMFEYQKNIREEILKNKHIIINKFTGAGMTETIPRICAEIMCTGTMDHIQVAVITGTNMAFTQEVMNTRIKPLFTTNHPELINQKKTNKNIITLHNDYYFKGYPTDHIDVLRGQDDIGIIFIDEAAFFHSNRQEELRMAVERYDSKTNPTIIWNSTPNGPQGAYYNIWEGAIKKENQYTPITLNWKLGLDTIFTKEDITALQYTQKTNPRLFAQEYDNQFISPQGSMMPQLDESPELSEEVL